MAGKGTSRVRPTADTEHLYDRIARNRRNSFLLIAAVTALLLVAGFVFGGAGGSPEGGVAVSLLVAIGLTVLSVSSGDAILLSLSGAREIRKEDHPILFNVVEEMAIAGGLPRPRVFLIEDSAPNAFAAGKNPNRSAVAVTSGLLEKLNREELQGVIGHEMSHIRHHDVLFGTLMGILVGSVALLCDFFLRGWRNSSGEGKGNALFLILGLCLAIFAPILSGIIQMAMSREREFLADAGGAELTRNPLGLASALEKIAADQEPLEVANRATQHLYIVNPLREAREEAPSLFDTHPPTGERVRILRELAHALEHGS